MAKVLSETELSGRGRVEAEVLAAVQRRLLDSSRSPQIPADEQRVWERLGADFSQPVAARADHLIEVSRGMLRLADRSCRGIPAVARVLRVQTSRISQLVTDRAIVFWEDTDGTRMFPMWQVVDGKRLRGLAQLAAALRPRIHPLVVDRWVHAPNADLALDDSQLSPIEWLTVGGDIDVVAELAAAL